MRLRFWPHGWDLSLRMRFGSQGWDLGLEARIWALWIGFRPRDWDLGLVIRIWASELGGGYRWRRIRRRRKFFICVKA